MIAVGYHADVLAHCEMYAASFGPLVGIVAALVTAGYALKADKSVLLV